MPDLPYNLASQIVSQDQNQFASNIETALYDITDTFNSRCDSERQTITTSSDSAEIPGLPTFGSGLVLINGQKNGQPAGIFIACKADSSLAGTVKELMQVQGTGIYDQANLQITWPPNQSINVSSSQKMTVNILWRN